MDKKELEKDIKKVAGEAEKLLKNADKFVETSAKADKDKAHGASALGRKVDDLTHGKTELEKLGSAIDGFASRVEAERKKK